MPSVIHMEVLPTPPVLGASTTMGHSTQRSLSIAVVPPEDGALLSGSDSARPLPGSMSYRTGWFGDGCIL